MPDLPDPPARRSERLPERLPEATATPRFTGLEALRAARGPVVGEASGAPRPATPAPTPTSTRASTPTPGAALAALVASADELKRAIVASGTPRAVATCDLVTVPYPAAFGLWRAATSPARLLWVTARMLVVQWDDPDGTRRTLLWGASDHEQAVHTPALARVGTRGPRPSRRTGRPRAGDLAPAAARWGSARLVTTHGTVLGHLRALGIAPEDVDYLGFDHLHAQDLRRLIGTTRPAADLGSPEAPVAPWFPRAVVLAQRREWESLRQLHPLQAPWYLPETFRDLPGDRLALVDGEVLLGPGVALVATPGHTAGTMSLVLHTATGVWVCSVNGIAAEAWSPRVSRIPGVRAWSVDWEQEVILNASTLEAAASQYDSMMLERALADPAEDAPVPQCLPSSELTPHPLAPGLRPTYTHGAITHGTVRGTSVLGPGAAA